MATYAHTIEIARPHLLGSLRLGSAATEVRRFLGRELESTWTCVEHEPCTTSAIECREGPVPFRGTFALEPSRVGTRFTWTVELSGPAARLAGPLAGRATRGELRTNAARLKALLERRG